METRRLRLLLLAFLRGHLQRKEPTTWDERIREEMLLSVITTEQQANMLEHMNIVASGFASVTDRNSLQQTYGEQMSRVKVIAALREFDYTTASTGGMKDVDASIQLYNAMLEAGLLDPAPSS